MHAGKAHKHRAQRLELCRSDPWVDFPKPHTDCGIWFGLIPNLHPLQAEPIRRLAGFRGFYFDQRFTSWPQASSDVHRQSSSGNFVAAGTHWSYIIQSPASICQLIVVDGGMVQGRREDVPRQDGMYGSAKEKGFDVNHLGNDQRPIAPTKVGDNWNKMKYGNPKDK